MHYLRLRKLRRRRQHSRDLNRARRLWPNGGDIRREVRNKMRWKSRKHLLKTLLNHLGRVIAERARKRATQEIRQFIKTNPALAQRYADRPVNPGLYRRIPVTPI